MVVGDFRLQDDVTTFLVDAVITEVLAERKDEFVAA